MSVSGMATEVLLGQAVASGTTTSLTSNTTSLPIVDTPPATGNITVAQSPLNTPTTNTGRTKQSSAAYMATSLNALNVGTTPPPTGNLPH
jgi:hypothetical protein